MASKAILSVESDIDILGTTSSTVDGSSAEKKKEG
jgi:hypothetical protein